MSPSCSIIEVVERLKIANKLPLGNLLATLLCYDTYPLKVVSNKTNLSLSIKL
jgi:hypothetical protein